MNRHAFFDKDDTIVALATPSGTGAIAVLRLSGPQAISLCNRVFRAKNLEEQASHTLHFGSIRQEDGRLIDEVLVSIFRAPKSFTREDVVEISCHGSPYIVRELLNLFSRLGARQARPGEFTLRAFLNGQFDLAQAEAVADLIQADSSAAHQAALNQLRGGFSQEISRLREKLIHFASLVELELDFGEEDVEFADRQDLKDVVQQLQATLSALIESFSIGQAIKNGVPTVIAGKPNAGKSTLLNALLNEERAIVSEIAGTTRDVIEDELIIEGIHFRFIDTAGLRDTTDTIEAIGVKRTQEKMQQASLILYLFDLERETMDSIQEQLQSLKGLNRPYLLIGNKVDQAPQQLLEALKAYDIQLISAREKLNLDSLQHAILAKVQLDKIDTGGTLVTSTRHYENLMQTRAALQDVWNGLETNISGDFLALDIRNALHYLGQITGEITTDDLLDNIFSKFCIGK